eukprot:NODE_13339_length_479_cov_69.235955_g13046_i0.p2 GENE.NODE_13339_length_479_cov_69.235955_g13046_i0~~NODE_13339_length_479_cov_69.235955_g13046_i0.p2  ORF type:complete len:104 (+),score=19.40 NODE_13339_length_479_cov_69.235955_g13046_i0:61-372(+)
MADPFVRPGGNFASQIEHLISRYPGTGHADTTKFEWACHQHRDSIASYIGHHSQLAYFAIAENEPVARMRYKMLEKMKQPCGKPPVQQEEDEDDEEENQVEGQ